MISVHIKQLETFYWAAKLHSFTAAADRLHATQSTVSMRILGLEVRLGTPLFNRSHRQVRLTNKGEELMTYVEPLLQLTRQIQECIARHEIHSGMVRIGVAEVVAQTWLGRFVDVLHQRYPKVLVKFEVALTLDLIDKLRAGALDVVLVPGDPRETGLVARSLGTIDFQWMGSPALAVRPGRLTPRDLQEFRIIALSRESYHYLRIEEWFRSNKVPYGRADICNSISLVASLTATGLGVSLLPPDCYRREIELGHLRVIETEPAMMPVEFYAIKSKDAPTSLDTLIVDLAVEVSTFARPSAPATAAPGTETEA